LGPHFDGAPTSIGRRRLPVGLVAILDDARRLSGAIRELHAYAVHNREPSRPRRGIVFRVVEEWERAAVGHKLRNTYRPNEIAQQEQSFAIRLGQLHIIDDSLISHACNRHASSESEHAHLRLTIDDIERIPTTVDPRNITEFTMIRELPRIIYEKSFDNGTIVVVEEIQIKAGLAVKTAYKKK
jgi:hypothetical protein